jgi:aspartate kinase
MKILIQKFGGTALGSLERIRNAAQIVESACAQGYSVVVVASAMGHATDELLAMTSGFSTENSARELDMLLSTGEQVSASLLAMALNEQTQRATALCGAQAGILTDGVFGNGSIKQIKSDRIFDCLHKGKVAVVTGYQGISKNNDVMTLGRGGSDTTAVALAASLHAIRCDIYSDVDGVYSADPRIVQNAVKLYKIPMGKMCTLANFGAQVMAPSSMATAERGHVPLRVRSAFKPHDEGTLITEFETDATFFGLAIEESQDIFVMAPNDSIVAQEAQARLVKTLHDFGIKTEFVHRVIRNRMIAPVLTTGSRHVYDTVKIVLEESRRLGLMTAHAGELAKLTIVGSFDNIHEALGDAVSTVVRAGVSPMFASHDRNSRISIMIKPDQIGKVAAPLHDCFLNANKGAARTLVANSVVA